MKPKNPLLQKQKVALDALLEMIGDEDYAIHQHHSDPDFTTQNGKMMGKGTETEEGALDVAGVPGSALIGKPNNFKHNATVGVKNVRLAPEPVEKSIDDAEFFKESEDEFEVSKSASGQIIVADTKSYGAGTPIGGTPNVNPNTTPSAAKTTPEQEAQNTENAVMQQTPTNQPLQVPTVPQPGQQPLVPGQLPPPGSPQDALSQLYQMTAAFFVENAAISIKESPKMLPPRDDMRRHIDESAKAEVMQGVNEPTPAAPTPSQAPAPTPQQPPAPAPVSNQQTLMNTALASKNASDLHVSDRKCQECHEFVEEGDCSGCGQPINTHCDSGNPAINCGDCGKYFGSNCCMDKDPRGNVCNACLAQPHNEHRRVSSIQTEQFVNLVCPGCHGQSINKLEDSGLEDGSLAECNDCGCFFSL